MKYSLDLAGRPHGQADDGFRKKGGKALNDGGFCDVLSTPLSWPKNSGCDDWRLRARDRRLKRRKVFLCTIFPSLAYQKCYGGKDKWKKESRTRNWFSKKNGWKPRSNVVTGLLLPIKRSMATVSSFTDAAKNSKRDARVWAFAWTPMTSKKKQFGLSCTRSKMGLTKAWTRLQDRVLLSNGHLTSILSN